MDYPRNREAYIGLYPDLFLLLQLTSSLRQLIRPLYPSWWNNQDPRDDVIKSWILLERTKTRELCNQTISLLNDSGNKQLADVIRRYNTSLGYKNYGDEIKIDVIPVTLPNGKYSQDYPMNRNPRGKAIIINVVPKEVTREAERFQHIFQEFQFDAKVHRELSTSQIINELTRIKKDIVDDEALMVMVITHGSDNKIVGNNYLNGSDANDIVEINQIVNIFSDINDKTVKLFFFTCCREMTKLSGIALVWHSFKQLTKSIFSARNTNNKTNASVSNTCIKTDAFIYYSCADGCVTPIIGTSRYTRYGRALSECFAQFAYTDDMASIMTKTYKVMRDRYEYLRRTEDVGDISPENIQKAPTRKLFFNPCWFDKTNSNK